MKYRICKVAYSKDEPYNHSILSIDGMVLPDEVSVFMANDLSRRVGVATFEKTENEVIAKMILNGTLIHPDMAKALDASVSGKVLKRDAHNNIVESFITHVSMDLPRG